MEDILYYSSLYDYYGELLTKTEQKYFQEYYFENLSLQEIADNHNISKNAISKSIKETKNKLIHYENTLHLLSNKKTIKQLLSEEEYLKVEKYI